MNIKTTVYLNKSIAETIDRGANLTGKSRSSLIEELMKQAMKQHERLTGYRRMVRYQDRMPACRKRFHLTVSPLGYERHLDMRRFFKMSVSLLVAYAVEKHLEDLINKIMCGNNSDNYPFNCYFIVQNIEDCSIIWTIIWGAPHDLDKLLS